MKFILASNNKGKLAELSAILSAMGEEVISQREAGLNLEAEETGTSFEENAEIKARAACEALGMPAIADDSGIVVYALGGEPGVYSARYGGESCKTDEERMLLLLKNMQYETDRRASFVSCIACVFPNGDVVTARGQCDGKISSSPRGEGGFGYDPIFELADGKTMSEISAAEKNLISHRAQALKIFETKLREYYAYK